MVSTLAALNTVFRRAHSTVASTLEAVLAGVTAAAGVIAGDWAVMGAVDHRCASVVTVLVFFVSFRAYMR